MQRVLLKSKIHRATVTDAQLHYEGSVTIDHDLMVAADIVEFVLNLLKSVLQKGESVKIAGFGNSCG